MASSTFVVAVIVVVVVIILSVALRLSTRRRPLRSRAMFSTTPANIPQSQQLPMNTRRSLRRQQDRRSAGIPNFVSQPARPISGNPNPALLPPFPSTPPQEPPPIHSPIPAPHLTIDLMERMRQVQTMMVEIHRLENESTSGASHRQRIQELQQRVLDLSDTAPDTTIGSHQTPSNLPSDPPPAYGH